MSSWSKITLQQFQQIDTYMSRTDLDDMDKSFFSVCILFNYTEYQLDHMKVKKVYRLVNRVNSILKSKLTEKAFKKIGQHIPNYDPGTYTLGQFISLQFYIANGTLQNAHKIFGVVSGHPDEVSERMSYFLHQPMSKIMGSLKVLVEKFRLFVMEYKALFGLDREDAGEIHVDQFQKQYGWIYSATRVADHNRVTLDEAMGLPVRQAFNDLAYLKAKDKFDASLIKRKK